MGVGPPYPTSCSDILIGAQRLERRTSQTRADGTRQMALALGRRTASLRAASNFTRTQQLLRIADSCRYRRFLSIAAKISRAERGGWRGPGHRPTGQ